MRSSGGASQGERDRGKSSRGSTVPVPDDRGQGDRSRTGDRRGGASERGRGERRPPQPSVAPTIFSRHWNQSEGGWGFNGVRR